MNRSPQELEADAQDPTETGPTLSRIGRRSDSRVLAVVSAAAVVFLAVVIAKPWYVGTQPAVPSGSTSSLGAAIPEPAGTSEAPLGSPVSIPWPATAPSPEALSTPGSFVVSIESDGVSILVYGLVYGCSDSVYMLEPPTPLASSDAATGLQYVDVMVACASGTPQGFYLVVPSPSAP
jgi:hypothetical protein